MAQLEKKKILYGAAIGVLLFFVIRGGGLAAVGSLVKYLVPIGVIYLGYRAVKRVFLPLRKVAEEIEKAQRNMYESQNRPEGPVIEICPDCHHQRDEKGRCQCPAS